MATNEQIIAAELAAASEATHRSNSQALLGLVVLLVLTVLTIWLLRVKRTRFLHETGLSLLYGIIGGLVYYYSPFLNAQDAIFNPEIFFYVLLVPIIFYAGYDLKRARARRGGRRRRRRRRGPTTARLTERATSCAGLRRNTSSRTSCRSCCTPSSAPSLQPSSPGACARAAPWAARSTQHGA